MLLLTTGVHHSHKQAQTPQKQGTHCCAYWGQRQQCVTRQMRFVRLVSSKFATFATRRVAPAPAPISWREESPGAFHR
jgi:hypothetical protein